MDTFSKRVATISLSLMGLMLCASVMFFSIGRLSADNGNSGSSFFSNDFPAAAGSIMMDYTSVHVPSQDKTYYEVMVWDSQTGRSKLYYYDYSSKAFKAYENNVQLPARPLD